MTILTSKYGIIPVLEADVKLSEDGIGILARLYLAHLRTDPYHKNKHLFNLSIKNITKILSFRTFSEFSCVVGKNLEKKIIYFTASLSLEKAI